MSSSGPNLPHRGRILVIDDETAILGSVRRILGREYDVTTVSRATDALELLARGEEYGLILCDLNMPEMTGMQLYAELVQRVPGCHERIVFVTGGGFNPVERAFLDSIPNERYAKPMDVGALRTLAKRFLT